MRLLLLLQSMDDQLDSGNWLDAILDPFMNAFGDLWVAIIGLAMIFGLYQRADDIVTPTVVLMLIGGMVAGFAPPAVARIGYMIMALGLGLGAAYLWLGVQRRRT